MKKKQKQKELCNFVVSIPRQLKMNFRAVCYKQGSSAKNAITLLMQAAIDGRVTFNKSLKFGKKGK